MGARLYDPKLARFATQDTVFGDLTNPSSLNQFGYGNGNPVTMSDPTGMAATMAQYNAQVAEVLAYEMKKAAYDIAIVIYSARVAAYDLFIHSDLYDPESALSRGIARALQPGPEPKCKCPLPKVMDPTLPPLIAIARAATRIADETEDLLDAARLQSAVWDAVDSVFARMQENGAASALAKVLPSAFGPCMSAGVFGGAGVAGLVGGDVCIVGTTHGDLGVTASGGVGVGLGGGGAISATPFGGMLSNADHVSDLGGRFDTTGVIGTAGASGQAEYAWGLSPCTDDDVWQGQAFLGAGAPAGGMAYVGRSYTFTASVRDGIGC